MDVISFIFSRWQAKVWYKGFVHGNKHLVNWDKFSQVIYKRFDSKDNIV